MSCPQFASNRLVMGYAHTKGTSCAEAGVLVGLLMGCDTQTVGFTCNPTANILKFYHYLIFRLIFVQSEMSSFLTL